tara:strand:+ start:4388 stop:5494 length:1107 start_codon:yes stop_codon:yes gene_type:complete
VESHPFDPYTQARPELYAFQRDSKKALTYFAQTRQDGAFMGTVETTAMGNPRESVLRILWKKNGGSDLEFDMVGSNTNLPPICSGYCKKTDVGGVVPGQLGQLKWVVVATKLRGNDVTRAQDQNLFSLPLFEAIATAAAFAIYDSDPKIQKEYSMLGIMAPAAVGSVFDDSLHGEGAERYLKVVPADYNPIVGALDTFKIIDVAGFATGRAMQVTSKAPASEKVGVIYPIRKGNNALRDGTTIDRIIVGEKPVTYKSSPGTTGICRYIVAVFNNSYSLTEPIAVLDVDPIAFLDETTRLMKYDSHVAKPQLGANWYTMITGEVKVTPEHVELATANDGIAAWDQHLIAAVEKAIYKIRTQQSVGDLTV